MSSPWLFPDWDVSSGAAARTSLGDNKSAHARNARALIIRFLVAVRNYLHHESLYDSASTQRLLSKHRGAWALFVKGDTAIADPATAVAAAAAMAASQPADVEQGLPVPLTAQQLLRWVAGALDDWSALQYQAQPAMAGKETVPAA